MTFVYIAPLVNKRAFKIGKAINPQERILGLTRFYEFNFEDISLINCKEASRSYKVEYLLHSACESKRIIYEYDGGTEFFDYCIYEKAMEIVKDVALINEYTIDKMAPIVDIKGLQDIKTDEIELLLNALCNKIKNKRLGYNMTQNQLAKVTGIGLRTIRNIENDGNTTLPNFIRVLKALDLDYILSDLEVETPMKERAR